MLASARRVVLPALIFIVLVAMSGRSLAADKGKVRPGPDYRGLISTEDYYYSESGSSYEFHLLTTRIRLDANRLNESGTLSVHFDGRTRNSLGPRDYVSSSIKKERIDTLNLEYAGPYLSFSAGRLWTKEVPVERVDGVNLVYEGVKLGAGFFGGAKPNPYTESFGSDFTSIGTYGFYRREGLSTSLALIRNNYKGETDREYLSGQISYFPVREWLIFGTVTADLDQIRNELKLTTGIAELSYRPDYRRSVSVGYNSFRTIRFYKSMDFVVDDSRQVAYYVRGNYRIFKRYMMYWRLERQTRYYPSLETDLQSMNSYRAGLTRDNLFNYGIGMNLSVAVTDNYNSMSKSYSMELSRLNWEIFQVDLHGTYLQTSYGLTDGSDSILSFGSSGYLYLKKKWNLSFSVDSEQGNDYMTTRMVTRVTYRF